MKLEYEKLNISKFLPENNINPFFDNASTQVIPDIRKACAGKSAVENGKMFETILENILEDYRINLPKFTNKFSLSYFTQPKHTCHFGLPRKGDFKLKVYESGQGYRENSIMIECKQLGNVESHFDKISHTLLNALTGNMGNYVWLVYDYNRDIGNKTKIEALVNRCKELKNQLQSQNIIFELIDIYDIYKYLNLNYLKSL